MNDLPKNVFYDMILDESQNYTVAELSTYADMMEE